MESNRLLKINRLIQKELGEIFLLETKRCRGTDFGDHRATTADLGIAHAYLSVFPSEKAKELVENINENVKTVRYNLGKRLRNQLRVIPELVFHVDDSLDYIENIDRLLKNE